MKRSLATFVVGLALLTGVGLYVITTSRPAQAGVTVPYSQVPRFALYAEAGLNVAAGAVITSPVYVLDKANECTVLAENSAGAADRALTVNWLASDGTTILYQQSVTVTAGTRKLVAISNTAGTASPPTGVTVIPTTTGKRMSFALASAGAAVGSLVIYCQ